MAAVQNERLDLQLSHPQKSPALPVQPLFFRSGACATKSAIVTPKRPAAEWLELADAQLLQLLVQAFAGDP